MKKIGLLLQVIAIFVFVIHTSCSHEPQYKIGVSQCSDDDWRILMNEQIEREAMFHPEARVEIRSANDDSRKQIADIRYFIDNDFDLIIAAPNEADALTPVISEAYDRDIPVLIFDRNVNGDKFTAFQGADNAGIGREAAKYAARLLPDGGRIIELQGLPGSTPAHERGRGFGEVTDSLGKAFQIVARVPANWNYDEAMKKTDSLLTLYPDVDLIYAHNDRMALGASDMAKKKGLRPYIIGIDGAENIGMKAVAEGKIDATFFYPSEGDRLLTTALAILNGEPYEKKLLIPASHAIDRSNVDLLLLQMQNNNNETFHMKELKDEMDSYWSQHSSQTAFLYAAIAVLILLCLVLFLVLRTFWQHRRHRHELLEKNRELEQQRDLEKELNSQLAAATQSKLRFFTNVSHDLRTPLTLISEPIEHVANSPALDEQQHSLMKIANRNVKILHRLINQILDFQKFENNRLPFTPEEAPPAYLGREWTEAFRPLANKKHIRFDVNIAVADDFTMAFDVEKLERVIFNILGNAFKFTPVKGSITFRMSLDNDTLLISISDTGKGIAAENLKHIFARFYQVDKVRPEGSGIGLSLAKAFVEMHGGNITVDSREDEGSEFIVSIPVRHVENHASTQVLAKSGEMAKEAASLAEDLSDNRTPDTPDNGLPLLLVIDDNDDLRLMVRHLLGDEYNIIEASNGKDGIRMAVRYVPDAVICDVMMPGIDGMETCATIKREVSTSHIPVLMLTACSMDEQRVEGYESGADGYLSKPFGADMLKARLNSLLANRRRIKEVLGGSLPLAQNAPSQKESRPRDAEKEFYARFLSLVNSEMANMDLSVETLAEKMGMGRSQFYRKIKALTNLSPVELLRDLRLKKARELLLTTDKTISEIAYEVGFSTPAYFTKCYREVYSQTPSALRENMKK